MTGIQEEFDKLSPYVIGIRREGKIPVVDVLLKNKWILPKTDVVKITKGKDNYFMFFSQSGSLDDIIAYIKEVIEYNKEKELKSQLYKLKLNELKVLFRSNTLAELRTLEYVTDNVTTDVPEDDFDDEEDFNSGPVAPVVSTKPISRKQQKQPSNEPVTEEIINAASSNETENFENQSKKTNTKKVKGQTIEVPNKKRKAPVVEDHSLNIEAGPCNCVGQEACPKCMHTKDLVSS